MALPDIEQLIGSSVTEEGFKSALKQFLENVVGLDVFNANKFLKPRVITESIDWNDFREEGFFKFISGTTWDNCLNRPPINNQWAYGIILPVSNAVCGQFAWCFNAQKLVFRFSNASSVWPAEWTVFSGDVALTSIIKAAVNVDRDATFDARAVNSITPIFESLSKNFFDKNTPLLMNRRINQFGELEEHQKSITTPLISVAGMASIVVSGLQASPEAYRAYRFFDKDKKFIRNDSIDPNKTAKVITVPNNAAWFQITLKDGIDTWTLNTDTIQFESGNVATAYTPYIRGKLKNIYGTDFYVDPVQVYTIADPVFENLSKNIFDKSVPLLLNSRITAAGVLEPHLNSVTTQPIYIKGLTSITVSGLTASSIAYRAYRLLDKDKKWIRNAPVLLNATSVTANDIPANAVYFQICLKDGIDTWTLNTDTIQFESGNVATAYTPYIRGKLKNIYGTDFYVDPVQVYTIADPVFENLSKNIFDKSVPLLLNSRITAAGVLEPHLNSVTTQPIYIKGLTSITVSGLTASSIAYRAYRLLDKDKKWIRNAPVLLNATSVTANDIPANAVYFQICLKDGIDTWALNLDTIQIESGTVATSYTAYIKGKLKALFGTELAGSSSGTGGIVSRAFGAKYLFFGDSITQTSRVDEGIFDETTTPFPNWPTYAKDQLKMSGFRNYAKSGASFRESGQTNPWQMMSHQVNTAIANAETPDIIVVAMGTNDGVTANLGDYETAMSKPTLGDLDRSKTLEAARWAFWTIKKNFPNAVCFYANPLQRASADSTELAPLIDGLSKMARRYGFTLIDQHNECGIIRDLETGSQHLYLADGLHPNTAGRILQACYIVSVIIARMTYSI
ncbi:SGNH/GDSL hydrolase family protein [Acinetobacter baumannii]|uniref:SGNH/GDSL hydrolase family protein n=1 Tax=Acinetobacter baumannii TaxID=470 RepID=UPI000A34E14B|nr:SGNH/GDSL hydrolase family protein [Acinetobacter baumannii]OTK75489.1 hypothetical protein B9X89_17550 [Acinetobacter baumannii]